MMKTLILSSKAATHLEQNTSGSRLRDRNRGQSKQTPQQAAYPYFALWIRTRNRSPYMRNVKPIISTIGLWYTGWQKARNGRHSPIPIRCRHINAGSSGVGNAYVGLFLCFFIGVVVCCHTALRIVAVGIMSPVVHKVFAFHETIGVLGYLIARC